MRSLFLFGLIFFAGLFWPKVQAKTEDLSVESDRSSEEICIDKVECS